MEEGYRMCSNCKFWSKIDSEAGIGECCRRPPVVYFNLVTQDEETAWPKTGDSDWCGGYKQDVSNG